MTTRRLTIIESPFAAGNGRSMDDNLLYLRACLLDSWARGELPFASHGFFPLFLNELEPKERIEGITAGYQFWDFVLDDAATPYPRIVFYADWGFSTGMKMAQRRAHDLDREIEIRFILPEGNQ